MVTCPFSTDTRPNCLGVLRNQALSSQMAAFGSGASEGCQAVRAIKKMMCEHISLASIDEAAAADGSCPLEQVADASGIAVGGSVVQMTRDLSRLKALMTHSKSLTPAQQQWPPLIQEAVAQLEVKRATRKMFGSIRTICWTDHANLTRSQTSDIGADPKLVRWVSEILMDGSEIRSLSGRSATLGDSFSRNRKDRDALLEARTKDLAGVAKGLRGFDLAEYLGEGTEGEGPVPWAVGKDVVPDSTVPRATFVTFLVRVLIVMDYARWEDQVAVLDDIRRTFLDALPGVSVACRAAWGPFEDADGVPSHFDGAVGRISGPKRAKRLRVDLLTSCAKLLREATGFRPQFLVGLGQGAIIAAAVRWPLVVELTLQARNLQRKEAHAAGLAWAGIRCVWARKPRVWDAACSDGGRRVLPWKSFPEAPLRGFGVPGPGGEESLGALRLNAASGIDSAAIRGMLDEPAQEMGSARAVRAPICSHAVRIVSNRRRSTRLLKWQRRPRRSRLAARTKE